MRFQVRSEHPATGPFLAPQWQPLSTAQLCSRLQNSNTRVWERATFVPILQAAADPSLPHRQTDTLTQGTILPPQKPASQEP